MNILGMNIWGMSQSFLSSRHHRALINARLIDPGVEEIRRGSILIKDGIIEDIGAATMATADDIERIDCQGLCVAPGLVDLRVALREPGLEHQETIASSLAAAARGGVTTVVFVSDGPVCIDSDAILGFILGQAKSLPMVKVHPCAAITRGLAGKQISEMGILSQAGAIAFSDGWHTIEDTAVLHRALNYARGFDQLIIHHPQDPHLSAAGVMNDGELATRLGLTGIIPAAEAITLERDIRLAEISGTRYHAAHISTAESVRIIERAKERSIHVTCDTAPPYFALNELAVADYRTYARLDPPLRSEDDRRAIVDGLARGVIDAIASDHLPQDEESKRLPFEQARPGAVGLETLLAATLELVHNGSLTLPRAIAQLSLRPAEILGLKPVRLARGSAADLIVFDPDVPWIVDPSCFVGKSRNTPFDRRQLQGQVEMTLSDGRILYSGKNFPA